ncbi:MAG: hypothetical protein ABSD20_11460 [Terriglobales bacterium]|jgi:hypothetical protein
MDDNTPGCAMLAFRARFAGASSAGFQPFVAAAAKVKSLVQSHRMLRTLGNEDQTQSEIRK